MIADRVCFLLIEGPGEKETVKGDLGQEIRSRFKLEEIKKEIALAFGLDVRIVRKVLRQKKTKLYART
jgi:DNA invertase Pin-like site-specific DNA recombinase